MNIEVIAISKLKNQHLKTLCNDYIERIQHYNPITFLEIRDLSKLKEEKEIVLLDEQGKEMESKQFANWIQNKQNCGAKKITFVIGDSDGWSTDTKNRHQQKISLSKLTMQHDIARLVFLEQLYRAFTILKGHPYHRGI